MAIECKLKSTQIHPALKYFKARFPKTECIQLNLENEREYISKEGRKIQTRLV